MENITQVFRRSPMRYGRMPSKHPNEVNQPLTKPPPMCESITNHLPSANPSQTIQGLIILHVPQISGSIPKHGVNTFKVTMKSNMIYWKSQMKRIWANKSTVIVKITVKLRDKLIKINESSEIWSWVAFPLRIVNNEWGYHLWWTIVRVRVTKWVACCSWMPNGELMYLTIVVEINSWTLATVTCHHLPK